MRPIQRAALTGLMALWLAPLPALAESQSSNSSSNCSNGRCTGVESFEVEDRYGRRGWTAVERWREGSRRDAPRRWREDERGYHAPGGSVPFGYAPNRRGGRDDD